MDPKEPEKRRMLNDAGYKLHDVHDVWVNERLDRQLDGGIERGLTVEQLAKWIEAGQSRPRLPIMDGEDRSRRDRTSAERLHPAASPVAARGSRRS